MMAAAMGFNGGLKNLYHDCILFFTERTHNRRADTPHSARSAHYPAPIRRGGPACTHCVFTYPGRHAPLRFASGVQLSHRSTPTQSHAFVGADRCVRPVYSPIRVDTQVDPYYCDMHPQGRTSAVNLVLRGGHDDPTLQFCQVNESKSLL